MDNGVRTCLLRIQPDYMYEIATGMYLAEMESYGSEKRNEKGCGCHPELFVVKRSEILVVMFGEYLLRICRGAVGD